MKQKYLTTLTLIIGISIISMACGLFSNNKPPHIGVFLKDGRKFIELEEYEWFDWPSEKELGDIPKTSNSKPEITLWYPEINLNYLELLSVTERKDYSYNATPKGDSIIELRPSYPLDNGIYCLVQGDPLGMFLPAWCFEVR